MGRETTKVKAEALSLSETPENRLTYSSPLFNYDNPH